MKHDEWRESAPVEVADKKQRADMATTDRITDEGKADANWGLFHDSVTQ